MRYLLILTLFLFTGCATKYILPGNRFITPEAQGGVFKGQFELQASGANELTVDTSQGTVNKGVSYRSFQQTSYLASTSIIEHFDIFWSHIGNGNSLLGGKLQVLGGSRASNSTGHKLAIGYGIGGNDYDTKGDPSISFKLQSQEYMVIYGYRIAPWLMPYGGLNFGSYTFTGKVSSSDPTLNGLSPNENTKTKTTYAGVEFSFDRIFSKLECAYQQLKTSDTPDRIRIHFGYSVGLAW